LFYLYDLLESFYKIKKEKVFVDMQYMNKFKVFAVNFELAHELRKTCSHQE